MNAMTSPQGAELNGKEGFTAVIPTPRADDALIPIMEEELDDPVIVGESEVIFKSQTEEVTEAAALSEPDEPAFDAIHSLTRLLVGGALEGSAEMARRLALWEAFLREEMGQDTAPTDQSPENLMRHALIGLLFEGEEQARRGLSQVWGLQKRLAQTAVRTTRPITRSRLLNPLHRRLDSAAERGQAEMVRWIQRGQLEEPVSRELARLAFGEIVDEFIEHLAENQEVKELVQQQGVGLANEMVGQVRERTFTADTLVERIARAITRRSPRLEPPPADLSEFEQIRSDDK